MSRRCLQRLNIVPTAEEKWVEEFPALNQIHFKNFYILPYKTVSDSKIHVFQYKLLHRILACKHNLFKWKIIDNDKCTHCNEIETIEHLFYNCSQAKSFITQIENWINRTFGKHYTFSIIDFLFGIQSTRFDKFIKNTNWIIIYAKWYMRAIWLMKPLLQCNTYVLYCIAMCILPFYLCNVPTLNCQ